MGLSLPMVFFAIHGRQWNSLQARRAVSLPFTPMAFPNRNKYMMYQKVITFNDTQTANEILRISSPRKCKALGRKVNGFDPAAWDPIKQSVVEQGSYFKYTCGVGEDVEELKRQLLATEDRELVEASRFDRVWGVGFSADQCKESWCERELWGQNLLGKALVNVRKKIREEEEAKALEGSQSWECRSGMPALYTAAPPRN
jgi:ribA/ribD-fused uncharacterized protein